MTSVKILYVDDDPGIARLVERHLTKIGYAVEHAASATAALERAKRGGIDAIALDHHMPGLTGLDVLPALAALPDAPPVIYVTGSEDSRIAVAALKAGAVDYVWKDVQGHFRDLLGESIATSLERQRLKRDKERAEREVRAARDRAEMLLTEVNHRVANSLALVASLANLQAQMVTDPAARAALEEMEVRIKAIAGVHRRLYTSHNVERVELAAYFRSLVDDLESAMKASGRNHALRLDVAETHVETDKAVSLGVIVTELVTNAYKYAYPSGHAGEVRISVALSGERVEVAVEDDGIGWTGDGAPIGSGLGTKVIRAMAASLGATLAYEPRSRGTRAAFSFPAGQAA